MDINKCIQIVLAMDSDQRTYVYEKIAPKCNPMQAMHLQMIFNNAQAIWSQQNAHRQSNNTHQNPQQAS